MTDHVTDAHCSDRPPSALALRDVASHLVEHALLDRSECVVAYMRVRLRVRHCAAVPLK